MRKGFTLIEILIVVAIIAILATIVLVGLGPAQQSGRDAKRLADLHTIQNVLELYYNDCGFYPGDAIAPSCPTAPTDNTPTFASLVTAITTSPSLQVNQVPNDPTPPASYNYTTVSGGANYVLGATLENTNNAVFNTYTAPTLAASVTGFSCAPPTYCVSL